jgi:glutamyl-Q tRNA(Asp) synthetase
MLRRMVVTRFAPSPTGRLHLGHAYSALVGWRAARAARGRFLLRIEDIDATRCREEHVAGILEDLAWLGLDWDGPVRRQSEHLGDYQAALARLDAMGLLYPCFCTRAEIAEATRAPHGPAAAPYPGTCRALGAAAAEERMRRGAPYALRLDTARALEATGPLRWEDERAGAVAADPLAQGDAVLARKETPTSYHLAATVDDALQGVTLVTRGEDLFRATDIHRLLQALLGLPTPRYRHHPLLADPRGRRLAKRDRAPTLAALRAAGTSPAEARARAEPGAS